MPHASPRRGRPATVSTEEVVAAAVKLIGGIGIDALTMRSLAASMGVAPMTLYRHVADKQTLLSMIPDALLREVAEDVCRKRTALGALLAVAHGVAWVLRRHRGVAVLFTGPELGANMEVAARHTMRLLVAEGLPAAEARVALRAVIAQVIGETITMHGGFDAGGVRLVLEGVRSRLDAIPDPSGAR